MAKIIWEVGDCFESAEGIGVVLGNDWALMVVDNGSRQPATYSVGGVPSDAKPVDIKSLKFEFQQSFVAALMVAEAAQSGIFNK